jgi:4-hydroxy-3-polyprenylbenzoate decarboxylase
MLALGGASGAAYGLRVLEALLRDPALEVHFTFTPAGAKVLALECGLKLDAARFETRRLGVDHAERLIYHRPDDLSAPMTSGSFQLEALVVVPCSMGCAARFAHGVAGNLVERTADVQLKERRRLLVVPRETPWSVIQLENLLALARAGAVVLPASPGFYGRPRRVEDLVDFVAARVLDHLGVVHDLGPRWGGPENE